MRIKCRKCQVWNEEKGRWDYHFAIKTTWKAPMGINPRMREFKCPECGVSTFIPLTDRQIWKEHWAERKVC